MRLQKYMVALGAIGLMALMLAGPARADYDNYDDYNDSNPLRVASLAVRPVGYTLEWLVLRPLYALVSQPQLKPFFGNDPYGSEFRNYDMYGNATPPQPAPSAQPAISAADLDALRRAADEAQAAADEAKRAADEAKLAADEAARAADKSGKAFEKSIMK